MRFGFEDYLNRDGRNIGLPRIPVTLEKAGLSVQVFATLDSGAEACLFGSHVAEELGIVMAEGERIALSGIGGHESAFAHILTMSLGIEEACSFPCRVLFKENVRQNLIGREDFFEVFRVTFARHEGYIRLDPVWDPYEPP